VCRSSCVGCWRPSDVKPSYGATGSLLPRSPITWSDLNLVVHWHLAALIFVSVSARMVTTNNIREYVEEELTDEEKFWRNCQPWLKEAGYLLRARYQPDWVPSWLGKNKFSLGCEDGVCHTVRIQRSIVGRELTHMRLVYSGLGCDPCLRR
jgi:hypothetical protein